MYQQLDVSFSVNINSVNSQSSQSCNISPQKKTCSRTAKRTRHIFGTEKSTNLSQISNGLVCKARKKPSGPKFNGKSPSQVERRNQRERQRVKKMNQVYKDLALIVSIYCCSDHGNFYCQKISSISNFKLNFLIYIPIFYQLLQLNSQLVLFFL